MSTKGWAQHTGDSTDVWGWILYCMQTHPYFPDCFLDGASGTLHRDEALGWLWGCQLEAPSRGWKTLSRAESEQKEWIGCGKCIHNCLIDGCLVAATCPFEPLAWPKLSLAAFIIRRLKIWHLSRTPPGSFNTCTSQDVMIPRWINSSMGANRPNLIKNGVYFIKWLCWPNTSWRQSDKQKAPVQLVSWPPWLREGCRERSSGSQGPKEGFLDNT